MISFGSDRFLRIKRKHGIEIKLDSSEHVMLYSEFSHDRPHKKAVERLFGQPNYSIFYHHSC